MCAAIAYHLFFNRRSGRFYANYYSPKGKRSFSCKTANRREAERYARERINQISLDQAHASLPKAREQSLQDFALDYIANKRGEGIAASQIKAIESSFRLFSHRLGNPLISAISVKDCEDFVKQGWKPGGWGTAHSARKHYQNLRAAFKTAVNWGLIRENPFDKFSKPRVAEEIPEYLKLREFMLLYDSIPDVKPQQRRFKNICLLAFHTGMRASEILHLERRNVDLTRRELYVVATDTFTPKSRKPRTVPLSNDAMHALRAQLLLNAQHPSAKVRESRYVFPNSQGRPLVKLSLSHRFKVAALAVFPNRPKLHFHSLRHSFGTMLCEAGEPLQKIQLIMGHSSVRVTERYARLRNGDHTQVLATLDAMPSVIRATDRLTAFDKDNHVSEDLIVKSVV